ncbi:MAG: DJ-1/PfpI family protein [Acidobacteria bacterium]|nr:DJ-1/PfpI family protein [Acidobacteriota bacterium]
MRSLARALTSILFVASITFGALSVPAAQTAASGETGKHWVCPPCGMPCDETVYDHPGNCPVCGSRLVDRDAAEAAAKARKKVAILIFTGVQIIDYTGPYEIFQAAGFDVYTVGATKDPITTVAGMTVVPKYTFADAPQPSILVVPGGGINGVHESEPTLKWITDVTAKAEHTMSVCNGAFILAQAGLLDGLTATTTYSNVAKLRAGYPKVTVVDDQRFVDNGKIITTGGLSAGIDGALHVVELARGKGAAQSVALSEEYDWNAEFARGKLADRFVLPYIDEFANATGTWAIESTEGSSDRWRIVARGSSEKSAAEILGAFDQTLGARANWTKGSSPASSASDATRHDFKFVAPGGKAWRGSVRVEPVTGKTHEYTVDLEIARAS